MMEVGLLTMMVEYMLEFCHDNNHIGVIMVTTHAMMKECGGGGVALPCLIRGGIVKFIESKEIRFLLCGCYALGESIHCRRKKNVQRGST